MPLLGTLSSSSAVRDPSLSSSAYEYYNGLSETVHALARRAEEHTPFFIVSAILIPVLVLLSGLFAGLTLGYMSLDETQLKVLSVSGSPKQQEYARKIQPIRKNGHLLLITLLISNMIVNETLPVISDQVLGGGVQAVVVSTVLIIIFAEIIPQSVCSRYGLVIGAKMAPFVQVLIWALLIVSWPVAKILELVLGHHHGIIYRRGELKELINMHAAVGEHGGDLKVDTVTIVGGALDLQEKVAADAMTPIDKTFMLDINSRLDYETLATIVRSGHSRIPVFQQVEIGDKKVTKILGILLVKQCVLLDPEDATPLRDIPLNTVPTVPFDEPLQGILNRFQEGRSHMAIVSRIPRRTKELSLMNESLVDAKQSLSRRFLRRFGHGDSSSSSDSSSEDEDSGKKSRSWRKKKSKKGSQNGHGDVELAQTNGNGIVNLNGDAAGDGPADPGREERERSRKKTILGPREQTMPADAVLAPARAQAFIETIEGAPLGVITLEDVLEELIGEEILDEYDVTGPGANPATTYVPPEAQRAVEAAQAAKAKQNRLAAAMMPAVNQMSSAMGAAIPKGLKALKVGVERSRSAPGRTRDAPLSEGETKPDEAEITTNASLEEKVAEHKSASSPPAIVQLSVPEAIVPSTASVDSVPSSVSLSVPAIVVQSSEPDSPVPISPSSPRLAQHPTAIPGHIQVQAPADPLARRGSPAPSLLNEAIMLERGRRRAAVAAALSGTRTPVADNSSSVPSLATAPAALPTVKDVEERLAAGGPRAKGARYKSSPLVAPEPGKTSSPVGSLQAQAQAAGLPPTLERKDA